MSEVKRYDVSAFCGMYMDESSDGAYVNYDDYAALQAKCAALAAENAAFKDINAWCKTDAFSNMFREFKTAQAVGCCNIDCMHDAMVVAIMHAPETPATDAFLTEVRAQGVEMFGQYHNFSEKLFIQKEAQKFAAHLRKGVDKK